MTRTEGCHCGRIRFEVEGEIGPVSAWEESMRAERGPDWREG